MSEKSEPTARFWHHAVQHGGQIYIRGGRTPHFKEERTQLANTIEKFEPTKELWQQIETEGTPHPGLNQAACVCVSDVVYFYGSGRKVLSKLDMKSFVWSQLWRSAEVDNGDTPMIKDACGMVCFIGEYLAVFGGYACRSGPLQPGSEFTQSPYGEEGEGWTNELHLFNINKKLWLSPSIKGTRPPPCCDFSLNSIHDLRAILFGGYQHNGFQDELYIIDFNTSEMDITFTKIEKRRPWPDGRECHTSCVLGLDTKHPQLLISGGKNMYDHPLKFDVWMLDVSSLASEKGVWKKVRLPGGERESRWGHTMTSVATCAGLEAVVVFGGSPEDFGKKWNSPEFPRLAGTTIFYFGNLGSDWVLLEERIKTEESAFFFSRTSSPSEFTPFELDSQFSMRLIFLMEKAMGIPLLSELANRNQDFQKMIQVRQPDAPSAINRWLSSSGGTSKMKPTWRNLSMVLHEIGLGDLALTMEDYLVKQTIDKTSRLEEDMLAHCDKVLDKEDTLRRRIHMFASHSEATIRMVKRKYDELRNDIDLLKREIQTNPVSVRTGTEVTTSEFVVKAESKEGITTELPRPTPLTGQSELEQGGKKDYWKKKFDTLSDESDSTIKMLKKENQKLRGDMDKFKGQLLPTPMETEVLTTPIKAESPEDITTAEPQPCTSTSLSANVAPTQHQKQQRMQLLHEQTWRVRYEQLSDQSNTTIQLLEEQSEKLREEVENLRRGEIPSPDRATGVNGDLNGTASTAMEAESAMPLHSDVGDFELRGVDVCGETMIVVTRYAQDFEWEKFGLTLRISEGTLPEGVDQCTVRIKASTAGQYQFPENFDLVSAIFWLRCEPACKFTKSVTMEMEHCAKLGNSAKLCFVRAICNQEKLPYNFKKIGGRFDEVQRYGSIEMNRFSGLAIGKEGGSSTQNHIDQREYGAIVFNYVHQRETSYKIDFVVTLNTKAHRTAVIEEYGEINAERDSESLVEFESERILVDIPLKGIAAEGGWKLLPNTPPVVLKRQVDSYEQGKLIPKCQFSAKVNIKEEDDIPPLEHRVKLIGAKFPFNTMLFNINPPERHHLKKRSASESDVPAAKRRKHHVPESRSLDSGMPTIMEDMDSDAFSPISNSASGKVAAQPPPSDISKPNMQNLTVLRSKSSEGKIEKFRLKSQIFHKWREIGTFVLSWQELEVLKDKDPNYRIDVVLQRWLSSPISQYPGTWEGLYELLDDCELSVVADELKHALENAS